VEVEVRLPWAATSILFGRAAVLGEPPEPLLFSGLYLDRVLAAIAAGREQCELAPFFRTPLRDDAVVWCRHQVLKNLEGQAPGAAVRQFAERMRDVRDDLARAGKLRYRSQKGLVPKPGLGLLHGGRRTRRCPDAGQRPGGA
jgi:DNA mismatch repair protein MutS